MSQIFTPEFSTYASCYSVKSSLTSLTSFGFWKSSIFVVAMTFEPPTVGFYPYNIFISDTFTCDIVELESAALFSESA